jgi:hypothetical protein
MRTFTDFIFNENYYNNKVIKCEVGEILYIRSVEDIRLTYKKSLKT